MLHRLLRHARGDDPFTAVVVRRLRVLGLLLALGGPVVWAVELVARFALSATVPAGGVHASLNPATAFAWVFAGLVSFAVAEIVQRALALRAELDGVV